MIDYLSRCCLGGLPDNSLSAAHQRLGVIVSETTYGIIGDTYKTGWHDQVVAFVPRQEGMGKHDQKVVEYTPGLGIGHVYMS